jgi:death on curing protein
MANPKWITESIVIYIHDDQIAVYGGSYGILNTNLLSSALARPRNLHGYEGVTSLTRLAASYGYGLVKNHAFVDGNKRTAFQVMFAFLRINGLYLDAPEPEVVINMQQLAQGAIDEAKLTEWLNKFTAQTS